MLHIKHKRSLFPSQALLFFVTKVALFRHKRSFIVTNVLLSSQTFFYRHNRSFIVTNVLLSSQTLFFFDTNVVLFRHKRCYFLSQTLLFFITNVLFRSQTFLFFVTHVLFRHKHYVCLTWTAHISRTWSRVTQRRQRLIVSATAS